jgi:hypothetical protein
MRFIGIGLAAALSLAVMAPAAVMSAPKKPAAADGLDPKALAAGMAAVPALLTQSGVGCTLDQARLIGEDKKSGQSYYEFSCSVGVGGVIVGKKDGTAPAYYNCLETNKPQADGKPSSLFCKLPGNADPKAQLAPFVAKTPVACPIVNARAIGASPSATYFEVGCADGSGFILVTSAPMSLDKDVKMNTCLAYAPGGNISCELTTPEAQLGLVDRLMASSGKSCAVTDKRYILTTINLSTYYEVACGDGKGYVLERNAAGALVRTIDCANAPSGAECTLTDAREAKTEQARPLQPPRHPGRLPVHRLQVRPVPVQAARGSGRAAVLEPSGWRRGGVRRQRQGQGQQLRAGDAGRLQVLVLATVGRVPGRDRRPEGDGQVDLHRLRSPPDRPHRHRRGLSGSRLLRRPARLGAGLRRRLQPAQGSALLQAGRRRWRRLQDRQQHPQLIRQSR